MSAPFKMKKFSGFASSPARDKEPTNNSGPTAANIALGKPKKETLLDKFKKSKLGKDLSEAGSIIKGDLKKASTKINKVSKKVKKGFESPELNPHTGEKESRLERSVGNLKRGVKRVTRKIKNSKLKNKLFKPKKKK